MQNSDVPIPQSQRICPSTSKLCAGRVCTLWENCLIDQLKYHAILKFWQDHPEEAEAVVIMKWMVGKDE